MKGGWVLDSASRVCTEHKENNSFILLDVVFVYLFVYVLCYDPGDNDICVYFGVKYPGTFLYDFLLFL